jgi:hypothetical protein
MIAANWVGIDPFVINGLRSVRKPKTARGRSAALNGTPLDQQRLAGLIHAKHSEK